MVAFKNIFSLSVNHEYYTSNDLAHFTFLPNKETQELLKKYQIIFSQNGNAISLSIRGDIDPNNYIHYIQENCNLIALGIQVKPNSTNFYQFTDLPYDFLGRLIYRCETNRQTNQGNVLINYSSYDPGNFEELALIKIPFSSLDQNSIKPIKYLIKFNSRRTTWIYNIITSLPEAFKALSISKYESIEFEKEDEAILENNQKVIRFTSNQSIPLRQSSRSLFNLMEQRLNNNSLSKQQINTRVIYKGLPNPSLSKLIIVKANQQANFYSPMYIYV